MTYDYIEEKYGDVKLRFYEYYKYSFMFRGTTSDGEEVHAYIGGHADDIYRYRINAEEEDTIKTLQPNFIIISKDGKKIVDWNNY